jgi:hypothetical protein
MASRDLDRRSAPHQDTEEERESKISGLCNPAPIGAKEDRQEENEVEAGQAPNTLRRKVGQIGWGAVRQEGAAGGGPRMDTLEVS